MSENEKLNEIIKNHDCNDLLERQRLYLQYLDESVSLKQVMKDLSKIHLLKVYIATFPNQRGVGKSVATNFYRVDPKDDEEYF
jgi:hypothetical protein